MKWRLMWGNLFLCKLIACVSLHFMLDPVQPLEYETGLFDLCLRGQHASTLRVPFMLILEIYEPNSDLLKILHHRNRLAGRVGGKK